jgi:hypothetical protein
VLSIVIPCRNGAQTLGAQLDALLAQESDEGFEVVVADNGSTDATAALVQDYRRRDARVRLVDAGAKPGINHARNTGVAASRGWAVLLCDADDVVRPGWLAAHARALAAGAECVGGAVDRRLPDGRLVAHEPGVYRALWDVPWPIGANCGFTRRVYELVGGFDESFAGGGDETDFFWRAARLGAETIAVPGGAPSGCEAVLRLRPGKRPAVRESPRCRHATITLVVAARRRRLRCRPAPHERSVEPAPTTSRRASGLPGRPTDGEPAQPDALPVSRR